MTEVKDDLANLATKIVGGAFVMCAVVFLACVGGTFFGALGGLVVGWFFDETLAAGMRAFGFGYLPPWQLGAFLGFVGGFFKAVTTKAASSS